MKLKTILIPLTFALSFSALAESFDAANHPQNFSALVGGKLELNFEKLPMGGTVSEEKKIWSGSYWPSNKGGIAHRFASSYPNPFNYQLLTKEEISKLSTDEMKELSPAELYDISQGDYEYSLTKKILSMTSDKDLNWEGINHGWAQASINYVKPANVNIINKDGILVPFTSAHVQALLSLHEAYNYRGSKFGFIGKRCTVVGKLPYSVMDESLDPACVDVNPGSFHAALTNVMGIQGKSFVIDTEIYKEVNNVPLKSFKSEIHSRKVAEDGTEIINISTRVVYADHVTSGSSEQIYKHLLYHYVVELDANKNITGGKWLTWERPDFMWLYDRKPSFDNSRMKLSGLNSIYQPAE